METVFGRGVRPYAPTIYCGAICIVALFIILPIFLSACDRAPEGMVTVPGGEFTMGTDEVDAQDKATEYGITRPWFLDEHPAHRVNLPTFYIDQYEVTNAPFRLFVQQTGRRPPPNWEGGHYPKGKDRHPVVYVAWDDARAYCQWAGKRLPTEAEWEKAARGKDGRRYPWGNEFDGGKANVNGQESGTTPVGQYKDGKSPYGTYDMIGNVWEWTADWYGPYPGNSYQHSMFGQQFRVFRGNSWAVLGHYPQEVVNEIKAHHSRTTFRLFASPDALLNDVGFRCAKSPP